MSLLGPQYTLFDETPQWRFVNSATFFLSANGTVSLPTGTQVGDAVFVFCGSVSNKNPSFVSGYTLSDYSNTGSTGSQPIPSYSLSTAYPIANTNVLTINTTSNTSGVIYSFRGISIPTFIDAFVNNTIGCNSSSTGSATIQTFTDKTPILSCLLNPNNTIVTSNGFQYFTSNRASNTNYSSLFVGVGYQDSRGTYTPASFGNTVSVVNATFATVALRTGLFTDSVFAFSTQGQPTKTTNVLVGGSNVNTSSSFMVYPLELTSANISISGGSNSTYSTNGSVYTSANSTVGGNTIINIQQTAVLGTLGTNTTSQATITVATPNMAQTANFRLITQRAVTASGATPINNTSITVVTGMTTIYAVATGSGGTGVLSGGGGGGGAFAQTNFSVASAQTVVVTGGYYFSASNSSVTLNGNTVLLAVAGANGSGNTGGAGGSSASSIGTIKFSGGAGGAGNGSGGGGGGGAGGYSGVGGVGGGPSSANGSNGSGGGGGGGAFFAVSGSGGGGVGLSGAGANGAGGTANATLAIGGSAGSPDTNSSNGSNSNLSGQGGSSGGGGSVASGGEGIVVIRW